MRYKDFTIDAEAFKPQGLWTWQYWLEKNGAANTGPHIPEGPEAHYTAQSAFASAFENAKRRIDGAAPKEKPIN